MDQDEKDAAAYQDGYRSGKTDRTMGYQSDYAWFGVNDPNLYTRFYSLGYRDGWSA